MVLSPVLHSTCKLFQMCGLVLLIAITAVSLLNWM
jgi:hypothetical protein